MYLVNLCNVYGFSAYSRASRNSESGVESDDLLFPIEEVVDNTSVENVNSKSGNMTNHECCLCTPLNTPYVHFLKHGITKVYIWVRWTEDGIKINLRFKEWNFAQYSTLI